MSVNEQEPRQDQPNSTGEGSPSRRAWIMRGLVTPILGMLAVASIVLGALNATIWKPSSIIDATTHVSDTRYIVTDPGVLPLVDAKATLTVESDAADQVCVALAAGKDINGWIGDDGYTRITGLESWSTLSTQQQAGTSSNDGDTAAGDTGADGGTAETDGNDTADTADTAESGVAFQDSDMWDDVACDSGSVTMTTDIAADATDAPMAIIDLGAEGDADITLHWVRQTLPDFAMPFYFAGGLLAIMAVLTASVFAMPPHKRRKKIKAVAAAVGIGGGADDEAAFRAAAHHDDRSAADSTDGVSDGMSASGVADAVAGVAGTAGAAAAETAEEVTIGEALAGTLASLKPSFGRRKRRRHAAGHAPAAAGRGGADDNAQPTIIDPRARNIVADTAAAAVGDSATASGDATGGREVVGGSTGDTGTETSVITAEELQAYFARLAQESAGSAGVAGAIGGSEPSAFAPSPTDAVTDDADESDDAGDGDVVTDGSRESADVKESEPGADESSDESAESDESDVAESDETNHPDNTDESDDDSAQNNKEDRR